MYSPGMPMTFGIAVINFTIIYCVDKFLLLRFYRTPKNYNEQCIDFAVSEFKYSFLFHFAIGLLVYSNDRILSSAGKVLEDISSENRNVLSVERYNSVHVLLFAAGGVVLVLLMLFESTITSTFLMIGCCKNIQKRFE